MSDPLWSNVTALLPFDGADGATTTNDVSATGAFVTFGTHTNISTAQSRFGGSSLYVQGFNGGDTQYVLIPNSASVLDLDGDFSVQMWVYLDPSNVITGTNYLLTTYDEVSRGGLDFATAISTSYNPPRARIFADLYGTSSVNLSTSYTSGYYEVGSWAYIEVTRSGNTLYAFINGALVATRSIGGVYPNIDAFIQIGGSNDGYGSISGWIDDLRITNGAARNTAAYTPPTVAHDAPSQGPPQALISVESPLQNVAAYAEQVTVPQVANVSLGSPLGDVASYVETPMPYFEGVDPHWDNVVFLFRFDGQDGDTTTQDEATYSSATGTENYFRGGAHLDAGFPKWGNTSLDLDGVDDYVYLRNIGFSRLTNDWCFELWFYPRLTGVEQCLVDWRDTTATDRYCTLYINADNTIRYQAGGVDRIISTSTTLSMFNQWQHVAVSKENGTTRLFINGIQEGGDWADSISYLQPTNSPVFGVYGDVLIGFNRGWFNGKMAEARYTYNVARYTRDFMLPTGPFPTSNAYKALNRLPTPLGAGSAEITITAPTLPAIVSTPSPLSGSRSLINVDFQSLITDPTEYYVARITGDPVLEVPISSWQATLRTDGEAFLQIVIPNAGQYVNEIGLRQPTSTMQVYRRTVIDGNQVESLFANTRITTIEIARGSRNYTATLRGYFDKWDAPAPSTIYDLKNVRTVFQSSTGSIRARCDIDWNVRPNYQVTVEGSQFTVGYVNFYVPAVGDSYMDVGTRG